MKTIILYICIFVMTMSLIVNMVFSYKFLKLNNTISYCENSIEDLSEKLEKEKYSSKFYEEYANMYQNILIEKGYYDLKDTVGTKCIWDIESGEIFESNTLKTIKAPRPKIYISTHRARKH